ncbi:MAG: UDP-2,3-diacylglucosamine diphosphatase [Bernardetiaceae bacterium]|jgi:UDP-2,3-diacylglucosamine hydrolase|nr:UDP-2,3-diacylglucosamine diphosphatase [Bernardetiaceae bacterium]
MMPPELTLPPGKKLFFASDFHLGYPNAQESLARERKICRWLDHIAPQAARVFLMGDLFDFWFEYRYVVPKGFARFQGKLAQLTDAGLPIAIFTGNHDLWMFRYFTEELGVEVYHQPQRFGCAGKQFLVGHGDGLGPGDNFYKLVKHGLFTVRPFQWLFDKVPPFVGMGLAFAWSNQSKKKGTKHVFLADQEWIWHYCQQVAQTQPADYYLFGHRHHVLDLPVPAPNGQVGRYYNVGEWLSYCSFAEFDGQEIRIVTFEGEKPLPILPTV